MPYSKAEFDAAVQTQYKQAVANAAGTVSANVDILSISESRRRAASIALETKIRASDAAGASGIASALGSGDALKTRLDAALMDQGLKGSLEVSSLTTSSSQLGAQETSLSVETANTSAGGAGGGTLNIAIIAGVAGGVVLLLIASALMYFRRRRISKAATAAADAGDIAMAPISADHVPSVATDLIDFGPPAAFEPQVTIIDVGGGEVAGQPVASASLYCEDAGVSSPRQEGGEEALWEEHGVIPHIAVTEPLQLVDAQPMASGGHKTASEGAPEKQERLIQHVAFTELTVDAQPVGVGSYKTVYKAKWSGKNASVAVLELRNTRDAPLTAIQQEMRIFAKLGKHRHLAQLLATTTHAASGNQCLLMEFAPQGSLDQVLNKAADADVDVSRSVRIAIGVQVADAMVHLDLYKVIHRDLAARNVLVFGFDALDWKAVHVKVTDYGLALLTDKGLTHAGKSMVEVSTQSASAAGPMRWMAVESLERRVYSNKSDVWAFGVLLWEIMTLGFLPYNAIGDDTMVAQAVMAGERLPKPDQCPDEVYAIMQSCWHQKPKDRPTMPAIHIDLQGTFAQAENNAVKTTTRPSEGEDSITSTLDNKCVVCLDNLPTMAVLPCGHRCLCEGCATLELSRCPMCRQPVDDTKRIFG